MSYTVYTPKNDHFLAGKNGMEGFRNSSHFQVPDQPHVSLGSRREVHVHENLIATAI